MSSTKVSQTSKRPRRRKKPIEPIHVEELLGGAGMSGFLGVLDRPAPAAHLQILVREPDGRRTTRALSATLEMSERVASVVSKVQALTELIKAKAKSQGE